MKLCMVGTGYVGLVSGACFAETGADVICADVDASKIATLEAGGIPIYEPGLKAIVERNVEAGRLRFTTDVAEAIRQATVVFVAVGTPPRGDGGANLSAVDAVATQVAKEAQREMVLVCKSTVPVGTNARVRRLVENAAHPIHVVSNPEFLKEGDAVADFLKPDRVVIGCDPDDAFARGIMERLYHPVCLERSRLVFMDPASAELTKYVANTMLAMRISFMNEVAGALRQGRRGRALGAPRRRQRHAHRRQVPLRGARLRRELLPEGREGARAHRAATTASSSSSRRRPTA